MIFSKQKERSCREIFSMSISTQLVSGYSNCWYENALRYVNIVLFSNNVRDVSIIFVYDVRL